MSDQYHCCQQVHVSQLGYKGNKPCGTRAHTQSQSHLVTVTPGHSHTTYKGLASCVTIAGLSAGGAPTTGNMAFGADTGAGSGSAAQVSKPWCCIVTSHTHPLSIRNVTHATDVIGAGR